MKQHSILRSTGESLSLNITSKKMLPWSSRTINLHVLISPSLPVVKIPLITTPTETTTGVAGMKDNLYTSKLSAIRALWTPIICLPRHTGGVFSIKWIQADPRAPGSPRVLCRLSRGSTVASGQSRGVKGWRVCEVAYDLPIWPRRNSGALWGETSARAVSPCTQRRTAPHKDGGRRGGRFYWETKVLWWEHAGTNSALVLV